MDNANDSRKALISGQTLAMSLETKRLLAIELMGDKHVFHKAYQSTPNHVTNHTYQAQSILNGRM